MNQDHLADRLLARLRQGPVVDSAGSGAPEWSGPVLLAAVARLQDRGYSIARQDGRAYHLEAIPDLLLADEIEHAVSGLKLGTPLSTYGRLGSTNEVAARLAEAGAFEGTLVTAEEQTRGRGRQGRSWHSPPGVGIWMSLVLRPQCNAGQAAGIPLAGALSVASALKTATGVEVGLKWPNDVYMNGRKVAGVLGESVVEGASVRYAVLGLGINVNLLEDQVPEDLQSIAGSVAMATGKSWNRVDILASVLKALEKRYYDYVQHGFGALSAEFRSLSKLVGQPVELILSNRTLSGTVLDLAPDGSLLLTTESGPEQVRVGEATLRVK
jgi:BirA family biotin operon repressor/biotin-[acetyl-CoA-carboxylase] ligase